MQRKMFYFLFFVLFLPSLMLAQGMLRGKVTDLQSGEPLIGANVIVEGTQTGAATDLNGEFVLRNLNPGVYSVKSSFIGYQAITVSNVRVNNQLTTEVDFQLPAEGVTVGTVEIIAERPMIQKDNTNKIRTTTSEDIDALPVRGVNNIIGLTAGVVLQNNAVFIRGGRLDEVGYYLEGTSISNPMTGGRAVTISQDAVEEIQVQAGGYTAEFGNANAGIVRQQLKSGSSNYKGSFEYITDNVTFKSKDDAFDGKKRLGTYWYGYNEMSATLSGPIVNQRFKFFANVNYEYNKDANPQSYPGINLGPIVDQDEETNPDSINFIYPAGATYGNSLDRYTYTGTFDMDFMPIKVRLSGTYTTQRQDASGELISEMFNRGRIGQLEAQNGTFNAKVTHVLSPTAYYELTGGYFLQKTEQFDPYLKDNFWAYGDSAANANVGFVWPDATTPDDLTINGFAFVAPGSIPVNYSKLDRRQINFNGNFNLLIGKAHTLKMGGEYQQWTIRSWAAGNQDNYYATIKNAADMDAAKRSVLLNNGVNAYGYDILGNETDEEGFYAPHKPVFAAAYIQDKIEYEDIILNLGIRYDYIDVDNKKLVDPSRPELSVVRSNGEIKEEGWEDVATFSSVSPRLGFSFPVTDYTMFHAQYGKFVQQSRLLDIYQGYNRLAYELRYGYFFTNPVGKDVRPTRTTQYELGFTQQLTDYMSFDLTGYYKDIKDQVIFVQQQVVKSSPFKAYNTLANGDFATTKGVEITLNMRRYERLAMNATLAFQDARGTGSSPNSNRGIVGAPLDGGVFTPAYISLLEYNNAVRGNFNIDYRFGQNDGPAALHEFGASLLFTFNSGHPYTRGEGGDDLEGDARNRSPLEPLNASSTPSIFQVDLRVDKTFRIWDKLSANVYVYVINLFDTRNITNVFLRTGAPDDDGYLNNPELSGKKYENYGEIWKQMYQAINIDYYEQYKASWAQLQTDNYLFGPPRQIRLGVRLEY